MDAYQHPQGYMRPHTPPPPPPPTADPYYHQPPPPRPPQGPWYPNQFQYQSPSPQQAWGPPPPPPPPQSYYPPHNQFPPPPPPRPSHMHHPPPPPLPHSQIPQSYPHGNQEWGNSSWVHRQGWDHQAQKNEDDWAARVKAWVEAKAAMESQHSQLHFSSGPEEQSHYHDQHAESVDTCYPEYQQQSFSASTYQQFPVPGVPPDRAPASHLPESATTGSGSLSYASDGHVQYPVADGTFYGDSGAAHTRHENLPAMSPSVPLQEVPSSYSSVAGKDMSVNQNELLYQSHPFHSSTMEGQHHGQQIRPSAPFGYGNQSADLAVNLADQPLEFVQKFKGDHDPQIHSSYARPRPLGPGSVADSTAAVPPTHSWAPPLAPDTVYPPMPPVLPPGPQHDPTIVTSSTVSGAAPAPFGSFPGPGFQSAIPSTGAPFGLGVAPGIHPTAAFPGDAYGVSGAPDRPKKAPVPNWLREEIIKKKAVISSSSQEQPKEETYSIEDESAGKSLRKGDREDSRSMDSSRSTEDDDDEDSVEAARAAAINQEIKRILTEVLSKVTDELFDEIATRVINEDDPTIQVDCGTDNSNVKVSIPPPAVPTTQASAKVLIPAKTDESETGSINGKSSSIAPANLLGLANYASDQSDEEDNYETQDTCLPSSRKDSVLDQSDIKKISESTGDIVDVGNYPAEEYVRDQTYSENNTQISKLYDVEDRTHTVSKDNVREHVNQKSEGSVDNINANKEATTDLQGKEARVILGESDSSVNRSSGRNFVKEVDGCKIKAEEKKDESSRRQDERHWRRDKTDDRISSQENMKGQLVRADERAKETESRKRSSHSDLKGDRREAEKNGRDSKREETSKKRERDKHKEEDRLRHRISHGSGQHKRRRSSSIGSRGRSSEENSSDETSDDSRRKLHSRRSKLSPSPLKSRRRQVLRSPHSKHSQRRHSPYSSHETTRGRRSRSKSPVRRHR